MKLTVVLADTHRTMIAIQFENEHVPYRKRVVQIDLTPEQMEALTPRETGMIGGAMTHEEILGCWLEEGARTHREEAGNGDDV